MQQTKMLWAKHALTPDGWQQDVLIDIDGSGSITAVQARQPAAGERVDVLLPAMPNLHSHAFQRAMAGMTETRGADSSDSFWTWRKLMYQFLDRLTPQDVESIAAFGQIEMLESGYTSVGEFHYLHHRPGGKHYDDCAEMSVRVIAAAALSGIGLTLLPVAYEQGGCDGRKLASGQLRFGNNADQYANLYHRAESCIAADAVNANIGVAPHSLRAVSKSTLGGLPALANGAPVHIHIAEQQAEVDELLNEYGARPVAWLLDNHAVGDTWCLIHATQMLPDETQRLAQSGAVAGLCPITESNLGDGIFDGVRFHQAGGRFGVGTDSNVRISLSEELRTLEYSQRLKEHARAVYAEPDRSTGRVLYESALSGGAQALQRHTGKIAAGYQADLLSLDMHCVSMQPVSDDGWLDAWLFAADDRLVTDVWCCGRHVVKEGMHVNRSRIEANYRSTLARILQSL
jgi:formimidoylglutamate deiminase